MKDFCLVDPISFGIDEMQFKNILHLHGKFKMVFDPSCVKISADWLVGRSMYLSVVLYRGGTQNSLVLDSTRSSQRKITSDHHHDPGCCDTA